MKTGVISTIDQLLSARKCLVLTRASLKQRQRDLSSALAHAALQPAIDTLAEQVKILDRELMRLTLVTEDLAWSSEFLKVPGIGKTTAAAVASRLAARDFVRPGQFVAYIGLDVRPPQAGALRGKGRLTGRGDSDLRRLLYVSAQASVRTKGSPFRVQYDRELAKGLDTTAALCSVARKLALVCWSLYKNGTPYDPQRVGLQPANTEEAPDNVATQTDAPEGH